MDFIKALLIVSISVLLCTGCDHSDLSKKSDQWISLFNGRDLSGWTTAKGEPVTKGWIVDNGAIHFPGRDAGNGSIYTEKEFYNFHIEFEWKVAPKSNSGVKYRFANYNGDNLGPEYQILDDVMHSNGKIPLTSAASLYALMSPLGSKKLAPVGSYNSGGIVVKDSLIQHWLNGEKVLEIDISSEDFKKRVAKSKFKKHLDFGQKKGRIMLQDHGDPVWYRSIRIREL